MPYTIEQVKAEHIQSYGGNIIKTNLGDRLIRAKYEATRNNGFFINQFANSDKAEEYHESKLYYFYINFFFNSHNYNLVFKKFSSTFS